VFVLFLLRFLPQDETPDAFTGYLFQIKDRAPAGEYQSLGNGEKLMTDWKQAVRRNKMLGLWAAEKLRITGQDAEAYSDALAVGTLDPEASDVLSKIRSRQSNAGNARRSVRCFDRSSRAQAQARVRPTPAERT
jgi:hypothetical protein